MSVYDNPKYYDIAFSFRDISAEVNFLERLFDTLSKVPVKTILELASGNSPHMLEFSQRGYRYVGLESNQDMINYANKKAEKFADSVLIVQGDMRKFTLAETADCALVFLGSLYVNNDDELQSHLHSVSSALQAGGLYILEGVVSFFPEDVHKQSWEMQSGAVKVVTTYDPGWLNAEDKLMAGKITLDVEDGRKEIRLEHTEVKRLYTATEFIQLAEQTGEWEHVESYSDFDINHRPKEKSRNILVLRKR